SLDTHDRRPTTIVILHSDEDDRGEVFLYPLATSEPSTRPPLSKQLLPDRTLNQRHPANQLMQANEIHEANAQASESGQDPHPKFQLSDKLRAKLENLAQWRLDPSLIEFPGDAQEFRGGFATVSQAHLAPTPNGQTSEPK
ncbi:hypothetical protein FRC05_005097, partial [Tulasnella sp. 425]